MDNIDLTKILETVKNQQAQIDAHDKKISNIEHPKPENIKDSEARITDKEPEKHEIHEQDLIKNFWHIAKWYPFMRYFEFCALQQGYRKQSRSKTVFEYSLKRPQFYNTCRNADFIIQCVAYTALGLGAIYSIIKILR